MKKLFPLAAFLFGTTAIAAPASLLLEGSLGVQRLTIVHHSDSLSQAQVTGHLKGTSNAYGLQAGLDAGLSVAADLSNKWSVSDGEYFGGVEAGYKFATNTELGATVNASVLDLTYRNHHSSHGGPQYGLYLTQDLASKLAGRLEWKTANYAPERPKGLLTQQFLLGLAYSVY